MPSGQAAEREKKLGNRKAHKESPEGETVPG